MFAIHYIQKYVSSWLKFIRCSYSTSMNDTDSMKQQTKLNHTKTTTSLDCGTADIDRGCLEPGKQPSTNGSETGTGSKSGYCSMRCRKCVAKFYQKRGLITITAVIIFVWILLGCFIASYHLMPKDTRYEREEKTYNNSAFCSPYVYVGNICIDELQKLQGCLPNVATETQIFVSIETENQPLLEENIKLLLAGLNFINPSTDCREAALPFLCHYIFPLCDNSSGEVYPPSFEECLSLSTETCAREWQEASSLLGNRQLPWCESLPTNTVQCNTSTFQTSNAGIQEKNGTRVEEFGRSHYVISSGNSSVNSTVPHCSNNFYLEEDTNLCKPECGEWGLYSVKSEAAANALIGLSVAIGIISGSMVLVMSCINYKQAFTFPSALVRYQTAGVVVFNIMLLIGRTATKKLFCSSRSLIENFENPTFFCSLIGSMYHYTYWLVIVWWFIHIATIYWGVRYPFLAYKFEVTNKDRYLHLAAIFVGLTLSWIPVGVVLGMGGHMFNRLPPTFCGAQNEQTSFYFNILPIAIVLTAGFSLLLLVLWRICKKKQAATTYTSKQRTVQSVEVKILIVLCYFLCAGIYTLAAFAVYYLRNTGQVYLELYTYFICESLGSTNECDRSVIGSLIPTQVLFDISQIIIGLYPAVNLVYAVNIRKLKKKCNQHILQRTLHTQTCLRTTNEL